MEARNFCMWPVQWPSDKLLCLVGGWKQKKGEVVSGYLVRKLCNILGPVWVRLRLKLIGSRHTQLPQRHTCNNVSNALYFSLCCIILIFLMVGAVSSHSSWSVLSPSRDMYICMYFLSIMQMIKEKKVFIQQETFLTKWLQSKKQFSNLLFSTLIRHHDPVRPVNEVEN